MLRQICLILLLLVVSCKSVSKVGSPARTSLTKGENDRSKGPLMAKDRFFSLVAETKKSVVHPIRLHEVPFRVKGLRTNEIDFLQDKAIVLNLMIPREADYVQVLRCPARLVISGGQDYLQNIDMYTSSIEDASRVFRRNNFWEAALSKPDCLLLSSALMETVLVDSDAPTGVWTYFVRACVHPDRVVDQERFTTRHCSRQVTQSVRHTFYNKRSLGDRRILSRASRLKSRIDELWKKIEDKFTKHKAALAACQKKNEGIPLIGVKQVEATEKMDSMLKQGLIGGGVGLGSGALAGAVMGKGKGALIGGLVGGALGGALGVVSGAFEKQMEAYLDYELEGMPRDPLECYSQDLNKEKNILQGKGLFGTKVCSCAYLDQLEADLQGLKAGLKSSTEESDALHELLRTNQDKKTSSE